MTKLLDLKILGISMFSNDEVIIKFLRAGARGFIIKDGN